MRRQLLLLPILLLFLLSSCSVEQRAQRHLRRALALDPTILSTLDTKVKIDTTVVHDTVVTVKATVDTIKSNIDSIITVYKAKGDAILLDNERLKVELKNVNGKSTIVTNIKEIKVPVHDTVRVTLTKTIPAIVVHERVYLHGFFWWVGVISLSLIAIFVIIILILHKSGIINLYNSLRNRYT